MWRPSKSRSRPRPRTSTSCPTDFVGPNARPQSSRFEDRDRGTRRRVRTRWKSALAAVAAESKELFTATRAITEQLRAMDSDRFDGGFTLTSAITESIWHRVQEMGVETPNNPRPTFIERVGPRLKGAVAQLRYLNLDGVVVAGKNQRIYEAVGATGAADVTLKARRPDRADREDQAAEGLRVRRLARGRQRTRRSREIHRQNSKHEREKFMRATKAVGNGAQNLQTLKNHISQADSGIREALGL